MKQTIYYLLIRDLKPRERLDGKPSSFEWTELGDSRSLKDLRNAAKVFQNLGRKTKIIRETTETSTVKKDDKQ